MSLDVSVVLPCLDEEAAVGECVASAIEAIRRSGLAGEVVVVDNGSTDRSAARAAAAGARVVEEPNQGYGNAFLRGLAEARGRWLLLADADASYDLAALPEFVARLEEGYDLVLGSRFRGRIEPGAMPWSHRFIGNPILTGILNRLFHVRVSDAHCGMRALPREALARLDLRTGGMEFASEMVIKAARSGLRIAEVPIVYRRRAGASKLRSFRDGWRHLRFMLLLSPTATLLVPGAAMTLVGLSGAIALAGGPLWIGRHSYDVHVMIALSGLALLGEQVVTLGLTARSWALATRLEARDRLIERLDRRFTLERGLLLGALVFLLGFAIDARIAWTWARAGFPALDAVRPAVLGTLFMAMGAQAVAASFFLSMLGIRRAALGEGEP